MQHRPKFIPNISQGGSLKRTIFSIIFVCLSSVVAISCGSIENAQSPNISSNESSTTNNENSIHGTYANPVNNDDFMEFREDGMIFLYQKKPFFNTIGTYTVSADKLIINLGKNAQISGTIEGEFINDSNGVKWKKTALDYLGRNNHSQYPVYPGAIPGAGVNKECDFDINVQPQYGADYTSTTNPSYCYSISNVYMEEVLDWYDEIMSKDGWTTWSFAGLSPKAWEIWDNRANIYSRSKPCDFGGRCNTATKGFKKGSSIVEIEVIPPNTLGDFQGDVDIDTTVTLQFVQYSIR